MKILLAEDDIFFQNFYSRKLLEAGFQVDVAGDGNEALRKIAESTPDIILLDLIMPNRDGFGVLQEIQKHPELKKVPVVVFSTLGQDQDIEKAKNLGASGYINKTFFDFDNLLEKIKSYIPK